MKKLLIIGIATLLTLCVSCNRDVRDRTGDYSYKLSGVVNFVDENGEITSVLATKRGQMNIVEDKHGGRGAIRVTFNEMNGGAYSCTGHIRGDSILFDIHEFSTRFTSADTAIALLQLGKVYTVQTAGQGVIHDNIILMEQHWTGHPEDGSALRLNADKITLLAEEN